MLTTWIAEEKVVFLHPDGRRNPGRIAVGLPVKVDDAEATCAVSLDGFIDVSRPIYGASTLQALMLAVQFLGKVLHDFTATGGRVLDPHDDTNVPLHAIFGVMLRESTLERDDESGVS